MYYKTIMLHFIIYLFLTYLLQRNQLAVLSGIVIECSNILTEAFSRVCTLYHKELNYLKWIYRHHDVGQTRHLVSMDPLRCCECKWRRLQSNTQRN